MKNVLVCCAILALAPACDGRAVASPTPAPSAPGTRATYVSANTTGLRALDAYGRDLGAIVTLPPDSAPAGPALRPGRPEIAFSLTRPSATGFSSDIYVVALDGTGLRPVVSHEADSVFYASPVYDPTGELLYFHRRAMVTRDGAYAGVEDRIERLDLRSGQRTRIVSDGAEPAISPDGRQLVYAHLVDGNVDTLWTAGVDGKYPRPFFQRRDTFFYLQSPRFRPTGCELVFSGAGHVVTRAAGRGKLLHLNIPSDLFLAPCDGGGARSLAETIDDAAPAWSPDGSHVAYMGTGALYVVTVADGNVRVLARSDSFYYAELAWLR